MLTYILPSIQPIIKLCHLPRMFTIINAKTMSHIKDLSYKCMSTVETENVSTTHNLHSQNMVGMIDIGASK